MKSRRQSENSRLVVVADEIPTNFLSKLIIMIPFDINNILSRIKSLRHRFFFFDEAKATRTENLTFCLLLLLLTLSRQTLKVFCFVFLYYDCSSLLFARLKMFSLSCWMVFMIERAIRCLFLVDMSSIINNAWISANENKNNILFAKYRLRKTAKRGLR